MNKFFLSLLLSLGVVAVSYAQEVKRWTITLSGMQSKIDRIDRMDRKLLPSVTYNFNSWLSAGVELGLPMVDNGVYSSTGAELFASFHTPRVAGFRLSISPVVGGAMIGAYEFSEKYDGGFMLGISNPMYTHIRYRWYAGLRPTIDYALGDHWGLSLSYGFLGVRSPRSLSTTLRYQNEWKEDIHGLSWGFHTSSTFNSSLRLGISYSF